jgi:heavy metal sensor kinase
MKRGPIPASFSLRARTTSWYVGLLAVALVVCNIGVYVGIRTYLKLSLQRALSGTGQTIADDFLTKLPSKGQSWVLGEVRESYEATPSDRYVRLSVNDLVLFQTADMRDPSIPLENVALPKSLNSAAFHRQSVNGHRVMIYTLPYRAMDGRVVEIEAGTSLDSMQETLRSLLKILLGATLLTLIAAAIGGYWLMKMPLRPLVVLAEQAEKIGRKELGERLPVIPTGDELERLTHSLNRMIERLEDSLAHNYRFSADASHELRTPLTIMRGEMEEILQTDDLPLQAVENLVSTLEEVDRMSRIVNSLMTITRLDAGGERMDMQVLDLSALARSTVEHLRLLAEEKELSLIAICDSAIFVHADPMRMKQVLVNLIDNAIKYTGPRSREAGDTEEADVSVHLSAAGSHAYLRVADHGAGISKDSLPHIFERFYRADFARSRVAGGVGLGLAIVKSIVTAHEGSVSITSTLGRGSTVCVLLPLCKPAEIPATEDDASKKRQMRTAVL